MKQDWINAISHIGAQSAATFVLTMLAVILLAGLLEWRRG